MKKSRKDATHNKKAWQWNDQSLQQSLELWAHLSEAEPHESPEEKVLSDIKRLLIAIKKEISVFES